MQNFTNTYSTGSLQDKKDIWGYLLDAIGNQNGVAGLMGNLYNESLLRSNNMENSYESKLGYNDESYTFAVDAGTYADFATDHCGYGLAQWTSSDRKAKLLSFAKSKGVSIGNCEMQCEFLVKELSENFKRCFDILKSAGSIKEASDAVCTIYERPANQSEAALARRAKFGEDISAEINRKQDEPEEEPSGAYASKVVKVAEANVGYKEKASNKYLDDPDANAGHANWNKFAADIDKNYPNWYNGLKNGYDWCDIFVDDCFIVAYGYDEALRLTCQPEKSFGAGCRSSLRYYDNKGQFFTSGPKVGDQIFFGSSKTEVYHTGLVVGVTDSKVYTVEGNNNDQVMRCSYDIRNRNICGYGRPAYDEDKPAPAPVKPDDPQPSDDKEIVYIVQPGDTLSKIAWRYDTTWKVLAEYNSIANPNLIVVGQEIRIPKNQNEPDVAPAYKTFRVGDAVKVRPGALWWYGAPVPEWVIKSTMYVKQSFDYPRIAISVNKNDESVTGRIDAKYLFKV